ncbi:MAG TPA: methylenetetrahydrofolate reductase [NAD(P)H] [Clostridia bacterium]|nr:methylenetetrahydrofolate reductase [NAD(P)H] [Clostridia bacterium]
MKIIEMYKNKKPVISFEISPPRSDMPLESIFDTLKQLTDMKPDYISVTYGAGGSQKGRTIDIAAKIKNDYGIESMCHFTCVGHSKSDIDAMLDLLAEKKLENILALRGDPPVNDPGFDFSKNVYKHANELIGHINNRNGSKFCVAAAAYLEGHPESSRIKNDILNLKEKVETGVDFLVTQLFFDNRLYYDFLDRVAALGINCPITPGIMPIYKADQIKAITAKSGCSIPAKLVLMMDKYADNPDDLRKAGIEYAASQICDLLDNGAHGIHLYIMNRPKSSREILIAAGLVKDN